MEVKVSTMGSTVDAPEFSDNTADNINEGTTLTPQSGEEGQAVVSDASPTETVVENVEGQGLDANATKVINPEESAPVEEENTSQVSVSFDEPEVKPTVEVKPQEAATTNWQDVIKNIPKKELAKAIGLSDFALEIDEHISKGGQAIDYLQAKAIDYTKVADVDLIKDNLRKELPTATDAQLNSFIARRYNQTDMADDEEKEFGMLTMQMEANKIRQERIAKQQSFKIPETPISNTNNEWEQQQQAAIQQAEQEQQRRINSILQHEATQRLLNDKRVVIDLGEGNKPFNFKLDERGASYLNRLMTDGETYAKAVTNEKGEPKVELMQKMAMIAMNPNYERDIFNAGKAAGARSLVEEAQNVKRPTGGAVVEMKPTGTVVKGTGTIGSH